MEAFFFTFPVAGVSLNILVLLGLGFVVGMLSGLFGVGEESMLKAQLKSKWELAVDQMEEMIFI